MVCWSEWENALGQTDDDVVAVGLRVEIHVRISQRLDDLLGLLFV
jgi:hypothetical protein